MGLSSDTPGSAPTLPQTPSPRRPLLGALGFRAPGEPETKTVGPADLPQDLSAPQPPPDDSASASGWQLDEQPVPLASDPSSSEASTPAPERAKAVKPVDRAMVTATAIKLVEGAGSGAHLLLAKDEIDKATNVFILTEEEAVQIGTPLGSLAARHSGGVAGLGNPDVNDLLAAGIGLAVYAVRQMKLRAFARNLRAGKLDDQIQPPPSPADTARDV